MLSPAEITMNASRTQAVLEKLHALNSFEKTANTQDISPLSGMQRLLGALDHPEQAYKIIHIAGTNGKGQTAAMIAALLKEEGYTVGLYTSPHVLDIREGVQINNEWISVHDFVEIAERVLEAAFSLSLDGSFVSYFDAMTAIACYAFYKHRIDWAVLEAGMGGKTDSTNAIQKVLAVITPISHDHTAFLGESLDAIADQKIGILTSPLPVVLSPQPQEIAAYLTKQLNEKECTILRTDFVAILPDYPTDTYQWTFDTGETVPFRYPERKIPKSTLVCMKTALAALRFLLPTTTSEDLFRYARVALGVRLPGRMQWMYNQRYKETGERFQSILLDGGHNAAALDALHEYLVDLGVQNYTLIFGMAADKLSARIKPPVRALCENANSVVLTPFSSARTATTEELQGFVCSLSDDLQAKITLAKDLRHAIRVGSDERSATTLIAGSFYLLQEAIPLFEAVG